MKILSGSSNWELTVCRKEDSIEILRAYTCDEYASLPGTLFGLPVTSVSDHAFALGKELPEGEKVSISCGIPSGELDNRSLRSLELPESLQSIGNYAFLNCRKLKMLSLFDHIKSAGSEMFMNCREFANIVLTRVSELQGPFLASAVSALACELNVTVNEINGNVLKLVFPEYYEVHTENGPTHFFNYNIEGGGYPYHHVFEKKLLKMEAYDALWAGFVYRGYDENVALRLAWSRLRFPVSLSENSRKAYKKYVADHLPEALKMAITENDLLGLRLLLDYPELSPEDISLAQQLVRERRMTEMQAVLLEKQHMSFENRRRRNYEL